MNKSILIVGTGALATLFAARLSAAGVKVTMLGTWREGLAALQKDGARLDDRGGQSVQATNDPMDCQGAKFALVLVKSWQTERAAGQLAKCLSEDGLAVTFQNGLGNDLILSRMLGNQRVSKGVITLGATLLGPGLVQTGGDGEVTLESHLRLDVIWDMLRVANFETHIVEDAQPMVWSKLIVNAAINPLTALLRVKNGEILTNPPARELMKEIAEEVASVAKALGVGLPSLDPMQTVEEVAERTAENVSSMLQDVLRGAPTEVDAINGAVAQMGKLKGIPTPVNRVICSLVKAIPGRGKL
jgi:2-dehydropantoate 2-reductase